MFVIASEMIGFFLNLLCTIVLQDFLLKLTKEKTKQQQQKNKTSILKKAYALKFLSHVITYVDSLCTLHKAI